MLRLCFAAALCVIIAGLASAADPVIPLITAHGVVEKADKDMLVIQPRETGGKFGKSLHLKLTGTSKITTLSPRTQDGKTVLTQRETDAKDLQAKQPIAVIYATVKDQHVLLAAVVEPPEKK
jgi:hypothetical protein